MPPTSFTTPQLKKDINTILELLTYIIVSLGMGFFYTNLPWWLAVLIIVPGFVYSTYSRYIRTRQDFTVLFPTVNDEFSRTTIMTMGILISIFTVIGHFVFGLNPYYSALGIVVGPAVIILGIFDPPRGWISVENNTLQLYGVMEDIDIRQLKEIILNDERIMLINTYGESKYSNLVKLTPTISQRIKLFLEEKLHKKGITITDNVINPD